MIREIAAAGIAAACVIASSAGAQATQATYRIEHVSWGNDNFRNDRIYVRDAASGKHMVLSRHWGSQCKRHAALNYELEGGCWYPIRESYSTWRGKPRSRLALKTKRHATQLVAVTRWLRAFRMYL
ncbi:MAG: hypothetical protein ACLPX9_09485 [Rhodomicrobium sp.]